MNTPLFVYPRRRKGPGRVDLATLKATEVSESTFFRRVKLQGATTANLYFDLDGPGVESLRAEFLFDAGLGAPAPPPGGTDAAAGG